MSEQSAGGTDRCENCGDDGPTADRTAAVTNPHTDKSRGETLALCETCARAFDMGAGNV